METIAVYFEPIAKSYGVHTSAGLVMVQVPLALDRRPCRAVPGPAPEPPAARFAFVMLQWESERAGTLSAVAAPEDIPAVLGSFGRWVDDAAADRAPQMRPVELVFFQGPHFYERYGIAAAALDKLREKKTGLLLAGFSGSMAYLVVPAGTADSAKAALAECLRLP
jgi:hypothetical protein